MKPAATVTVIVLCIVALLHAARVALRLPVLIGNTSIPLWVSVVGALGPGALALWLRREQRQG